ISIENRDRTSSFGLRLNLKPFSRILQKIQHVGGASQNENRAAQLHVLILVTRCLDVGVASPAENRDRGLFQYDSHS
ncbi:hypothetical protein, partial [Chamaesiphon sp. VAR_48_metabat_135_sub]|uniref:hypothetical protein n=1 Tax=Chamaesiphon sp. VAR_48_metabat_135_sub TaxID=2964699 RepID=UPI00286A66AB